VTSAGLPLFTQDDFYAGRAMSADFTGEGWRTMMKYEDTPLLTPHEAGQKLAELAGNYDFSLFEYWASDYAGHGQDMPQAETLLATLDGMLGGLIDGMTAQRDNVLTLITSDHGNLEDLSTRRHTLAKVPGLLIGAPDTRTQFAENLIDLCGITPAILRQILPALRES
jgi:bisphosphoglycerate-independent phosphoglycerate mutase (AlkP superfamily)